MLLNHAIVRMVPYEPHCTIHWEHFRTWQIYEQGIIRSTRLGEMDHRRLGIQRSYLKEFGYNLWVTHTMEQRGAIYDPMYRYANVETRSTGNSTTEIYWPTAEECFWTCTHPIQWTSRLYMDKKGHSPYYEHQLSTNTKTRVMIGNESGTSIRYSRRSPEFAYMFSVDGPVVFFRGRDETL